MYMMMFYVLAAVSLLLWIILCCMYKKIRLVIAIIQTAADFVR